MLQQLLLVMPFMVEGDVSQNRLVQVLISAQLSKLTSHAAIYIMQLKKQTIASPPLGNLYMIDIGHKSFVKNSQRAAKIYQQ